MTQSEITAELEQIISGIEKSELGRVNIHRALCALSDRIKKDLGDSNPSPEQKEE